MLQKTDFLEQPLSVGSDDSGFLFSEEKEEKARENHQLTITLILICMAFLILATPLYALIAVFASVDVRATPYRFAMFTLTKNIFEQVGKIICKGTKYESEFPEITYFNIFEVIHCTFKH